jgi:hypothetical protein
MPPAEAAMSVTIKAQSADGKVHEIGLSKTGLDAGKVTVENNSFNLFDIRTTGGGSGISCKTNVAFSEVNITLAVVNAPPPAKPIVRVTIKGTPFGVKDGTTDYTVVPAEETKLKEFIVASAFPPGAVA